MSYPDETSCATCGHVVPVRDGKVAAHSLLAPTVAFLSVECVGSNADCPADSPVDPTN